MDVMGSELEVPLQFSAVGIERDQRVGVEVVALAHLSVPIRTGVSRAPVNQVQIGIVGAGDPSRGRAALPTVTRPGFVARLSRARDGPEAPGPLTRLGVIGV